MSILSWCLYQAGPQKKKLWTGFVHTKNTTSKMSNVQFWSAGFNTVLTLEPFLGVHFAVLILI